MNRIIVGLAIVVVIITAVLTWMMMPCIPEKKELIKYTNRVIEASKEKQ